MGQRVVLNVSSPPWSLDLCDYETVFVRWICKHSMRIPQRLLTDLREAGSLRMCWRCLRSNYSLLLHAEDAELNQVSQRAALRTQSRHLLLFPDTCLWVSEWVREADREGISANVTFQYKLKLKPSLIWGQAIYCRVQVKRNMGRLKSIYNLMYAIIRSRFV